MGGRAAGWVAVLLILGACSTLPALSTSSNQASMLKVAFKQGGTYRYHYTSHLEETLTLGQILSLPLTADSSGDATWEIVSVDVNGDTTVDLIFSNLKVKSAVGIRPIVSGTTTTTTPMIEEFQFMVASTGEIVSGGGPLVLPPATKRVRDLGLPATNQLLAILPGRPVRPGDTWTKALTQPGPFGQGSITYTTANRFLRHEELKSGRAAVIETITTVPIDVTVDEAALGQRSASSSSSSPPSLGAPASGQVRFHGTCTTVSTTWFDTKTDQVEKVISASTTDVTGSTTGEVLPSPIALPSLPPGIVPASPGLVPPDVLGSQRYTGKQMLEFDLLT